MNINELNVYWEHTIKAFILNFVVVGGGGFHFGYESIKLKAK